MYLHYTSYKTCVHNIYGLTIYNLHIYLYRVFSLFYNIIYVREKIILNVPIYKYIYRFIPIGINTTHT